MPESTRPDTIADRATIRAAMALCMAALDADPALITLIKNLFATPNDTYGLAREAWTEASATLTMARKAEASAAADFRASLRRFGHSVCDEQGRAAAAVVAVLLGGKLLSTVVSSTCREQVTAAEALLTRLPMRTDLSYDAGCAATLTTTTAALDMATGAVEAAERVLHDASLTLKTATKDFDTAYGVLVRAAKANLSASLVAKTFPLFSRTASAKAAASKETVKEVAASPEPVNAPAAVPNAST